MSRASLFLCHRLPFPPNKGDKIRSFALLKHLAEKGPVHVACFIDDPEDLKYRDEVRKLAGGKCLFVPINRAAKWARAASALFSGQPITTAYFASQMMSQWVKEILKTETIDNTVIFGSAMAPYLLNDRAHSGAVLFDMVDVDSDKWQQYALASIGPSRWLYAREARAVAKLERAAARAFGKTLLVSPFEAETFKRLVPECAHKIDVLNNGVDLNVFSPGSFSDPFSSHENAIVMTGRMDYRPNYDGALWFAKEVAPKIFASLPKAHVYFVGSNPPTALRKIASHKITVTSSVTDIRPYIQGASVIVAPLLIARGVQNKVLEAMAMKKPVVATYEATRALAVISGVHLWIENDPQRFSDAVVSAIRSPNAPKVMENARSYIEQNHNWGKIFSALDDTLKELAQRAVPNGRGVEPMPTAPTGSFKAGVTGANA
jgi:polysaccharide biosynthesis protein PslH